MPTELEPVHGETVQGEPAPLHVESPAGSWRVPLLIAGLLGLGVLAGILWLGRPGAGPAAPPVPARLPPLSPEAEAYLPQIEISRVELSRWQNFLGQQVLYLDLTLTNRGARSLTALELAIEFFDSYQRVVLRESYRPVGAARPSPAGPPAGPLGPGESRSARVGFERLPADWDGRPPRLRITGLLFE